MVALLVWAAATFSAHAADYTTYLTAERGFVEVTSTSGITGNANDYYILVSAESTGLIVGIGPYEAKPDWASEDSKALRYKSAATDPVLDLTNFFTIEKSGSYIGLRNVVYSADLFQTHNDAGYMYVNTFTDKTLDEWSYLTPTYQEEEGYWLFESGKYPMSSGNWACGYLGPWNKLVADGEPMALNRRNTEGDVAGHYRLFRIAKSDLILYSTVLTPANGFNEVTSAEGIIADPSQCYLITAAEDLSLFVGVGKYQDKPSWAGENTKALRYRQAGNPVTDLSNFFTIEKDGNYIGLRNVYYHSSLFQTHDGAGFMYVLTYTEPTMSEWTRLIPTYQNGYWMFENGMYPHTDEEAQWKGYMGPWNNRVETEEPIALNRLNTTGDEAGHYRLWRIARADLLQLMQSVNSSNTADMTYKVTNPSFETGDMTGWTLQDYNTEGGTDEIKVCDYAMSNKDGQYLMNLYQWWASSLSITQTVENVPSGEYELSGVVAAWDGRAVTFTGNSNTVTAYGQGADTGIPVNTTITVGRDGKVVITAASSTDWWTDGNNATDQDKQGFFKIDNIQLKCKQLYLDGMSVRLPNNETTLLLPGQWYYFDVSDNTEYLLLGLLNDLVCSTDGGQPLANVSTSSPSRMMTLSKGRIYFKTTRSDATLFITRYRTMSEGTFTAVALNVDGLPNKILTYKLNEDGPGEGGTAKISQYLASKQYDFIGCSEDFNYNGTLMSYLNDDYSCGTIRKTLSVGGFLSGGFPFDTDGLNLLWKTKNDKINAQNESWTRWNDTTSDDGNQYVKKGYRHYDVTIDGSALIDVYILHMDAGDKSISSRESQWRQLAGAVNSADASRPKLIIGDPNSRWTREDITTNFMSRLNTNLTASDVWVELSLNGMYPNTSQGSINDEVVDKIIYINPTAANTVQLEPLSYVRETDYTYDYVDHDGNTKPLGDHSPVVVEFRWSKSGDAQNIPVTLTNDADNTKTINDYSGLVADVTLSGRTLYKDGAWNTLCLPFNIDATATATLLGTEGTLMELDTEAAVDGHKTGLEGTTLYLNFKNATSITAGTPYIIKWDNSDSDLVNPLFTGVTISTAAPAEVRSTDSSVAFVGTYGPVALPKDDKTNLFMDADNTLSWPSVTDYHVNAFRAYFRLGSANSAREFVLNFGDAEATGIDGASLNNKEERINGATLNNKEERIKNHYYDLSGRRLEGRPTKPGVYMSSGRKVVMR